jgi:hypothetical protein
MRGSRDIGATGAVTVGIIACVFALAHCGGCGGGGLMEPTVSTSEPKSTGAAPQRYLLQFHLGPVTSAVATIPADAVLPIFRKTGSNLDPWCSGARVGDRLFLTAGHCVAGPGDLHLGHSDGTSVGSFPVPNGNHRACAAGRNNYDCGALVPDDIDVEQDVATVLFDNALSAAPPLDVATFVGSNFPPMVMLGFAGKKEPVQPRLVCSATRRSDSAVVQPSVKDHHGDSGGPLVAFVPGTPPRPVVLGVVSRFDVPSASDEDDVPWLFTVLPTSLPFPGGSSPPPIPTYADGAAFATIDGCGNNHP